MNRVLSAVIAAVILLSFMGCSRDGREVKESTPRKQDSYAFYGKWVVVADASGRGDSGELTLREDGTFESWYIAGGEEKKERMTGTFHVADDKIDLFDSLAILLKPTSYNGKSVDPEGELRLFFNEKENLLYDAMTVGYARPGGEAKAKAFFNSRPRS